MREPLKLPESQDEDFMKELFFSQQEEQIEVSKRMKELRFKQAKAAGQLLECGCCCSEDNLFEDMGQVQKPISKSLVHAIMAL